MRAERGHVYDVKAKEKRFHSGNDKDVGLALVDGKVILRVRGREYSFYHLNEINPVDIAVDVAEDDEDRERIAKLILREKYLFRSKVEHVLKERIEPLSERELYLLSVDERIELIDPLRLRDGVVDKLIEMGVKCKDNILAEAKKADLAWAIYECVKSLRLVDFVAVRYPDSPEYELRVYDRGVLLGDGEAKVERICKKALGRYATRSVIREAIPNFRSNAPIVDIGEIDPPYYFPVKNGIIDLRQLVLIPYPERPTSPFFFSGRLPYFIRERILDGIRWGDITEDDLRDLAPRWFSFLDRFYDKVNREKLDDAIGSIPYPVVTKKKIVLIQGEENTGKTTLLNTLNITLEPYATSLSLDQLQNNRFATAELRGKYLLTSSERPKSVVDTEILKRISGGDRLMGERKFKPPFPFTPRLTLMLAMNRLPSFKSVDSAFLDRLYFIFPQESLAEDEIDLAFREKLLKEREGIFYYILWCYRNWRERGFKFRHELDKESKLEYVEELSSEVFQFVKECCVEDRALRVEGTRLYEAYIDWCRLHSIEPRDKQGFYRILRKRYRTTRPGNRLTFHGIALKEDVEQANTFFGEEAKQRLEEADKLF